MPASLFALLATRFGSPSPLGAASPPNSHREWTSFSSELHTFLSTVYAQSDSSPIFTEDPSIMHQQLESRCPKRASAAAYASLVIPVQELVDEYAQRFECSSGEKLRVVIYNGGLVLYRIGDVDPVTHPFAAIATKGYLLVKPGASDYEMFDFVEEQGNGYAWVTNLERSYMCKLQTRGDSLQVADAGQATLFEALFFLIHLVFQGAAAAPAANDHKRKFITISSENKNRMEDSEECLIPHCRRLGFSFGLIAEALSPGCLDVSLGSEVNGAGNSFIFPSLFEGSFRGERVLVKTYRVFNLDEMAREVWAMRKLESLRVDVVPRLLAAGVASENGRWCIVMEDLSPGGSVGHEDAATKLKSCVESAISTLRALHLANVVHNQICMENFIVRRGSSRGFWINLHRAVVYDDDEDDDPDEFSLLARAEERQLQKPFYY